MTIAPYVADPRSAAFFGHLRKLAEKLRTQYFRGNNGFLSMGMTNDFEVAIEEG